MIKYADEEIKIGNLSEKSKLIIQKTGKSGTLFAGLKHYLFGERNAEIDNLEIQYAMRQQNKTR
jgi:hypothetical protein